MRAISMLAATAMMAATAACQVTSDKNNSEVSVQYNDQVAANAVADVGNAATNIAGTIAADAKREAGKVQDKVGKVDVNVQVKHGDGTTTKTTKTTTTDTTTNSQ